LVFFDVSELFVTSRDNYIFFFLHYADANEPEIAANREILDRIEQMARSGPLRNLEKQVKVFADVIIEGRKLLRLENVSEIPMIDGLEFSLRDFLTHTSIHYWPFPHATCCPCAFCNSHGDRDALESHLEHDHSPIAQLNCFHSEVQLAMAGLLGVLPKTNKVKRWKCPDLIQRENDPEGPSYESKCCRRAPASIFCENNSRQPIHMCLHSQSESDLWRRT
jgi:hypothetical protein